MISADHAFDLTRKAVDTVDDIVKSLQQIERHKCSEEAMERIQDAIVDLSVFL